MTVHKSAYGSTVSAVRSGKHVYIWAERTDAEYGVSLLLTPEVAEALAADILNAAGQTEADTYQDIRDHIRDQNRRIATLKAQLAHLRTLLESGYRDYLDLRQAVLTAKEALNRA